MFYASCSMNIGGYQKLTLIDYPGKLATTVFTVGCSFRCPFCHNPELVERRVTNNVKRETSTEKEFFEFLEKRKGKLDGVCITGGEPTIQPDIIDFIKKIKDLGYAVKLDSNGSRPEILEKVISQKMVDFIAMDIKNRPEKYLETTGGRKIEKTNRDLSLLDKINLSIDFIMASGNDYEFRTTVVPGIHEEEDFLGIAQWISGAKAYWLQEYRDKIVLDPNLREKTKEKKLDLEKIKSRIEPYFEKIGVRG